MKVCHGHNCQSTALINAHVFPRGLARLIRKEGGPPVRLTPDNFREANPQLGEYDPEILCANCDGILGAFDDYVIRICTSFDDKRTAVANSQLFELTGFDGDKFAKGILAILWRASVSAREKFRPVSLGFRHETTAKEVLFGAKPLDAFFQYELLVARYTNPYTVGLYSYPVRNRRPLNHYAFSLCGFSIIAKIDAQRFPRTLRSFVVNGNNTMRGLFTDFLDTQESKAMLEFMSAHEARGVRPF